MPCLERGRGGIGGEEWGGDGKDREGMGRGGEGGSILAPPCPPLPVSSDPLPPKSSAARQDCLTVKKQDVDSGVLKVLIFST